MSRLSDHLPTPLRCRVHDLRIGYVKPVTSSALEEFRMTVPRLRAYVQCGCVETSDSRAASAHQPDCQVLHRQVQATDWCFGQSRTVSKRWNRPRRIPQRLLHQWGMDAHRFPPLSHALHVKVTLTDEVLLFTPVILTCYLAKGKRTLYHREWASAVYTGLKNLCLESLEKGYVTLDRKASHASPKEIRMYAEHRKF